MKKITQVRGYLAAQVGGLEFPPILQYLFQQFRTRSRDLSVEEFGGSDIIQTGSQKSWLIPTAQVSQKFDIFRNKLANVEQCSVGTCFLMKETALKTIKMSVSSVSLL